MIRPHFQITLCTTHRELLGTLARLISPPITPHRSSSRADSHPITQVMSEQQPDVEALTKTPAPAKAPEPEKDVKEIPAGKKAAEAASTTAAASKPAPASMENAPDPEEDDLDDLDGTDTSLSFVVHLY